MRAVLFRRLLVAGLILAGGLGAAAAAVPDRAAPDLPAVQSLVAGTAWRPAGSTPPVALAIRSREWLLDDGAGHRALLFVGATAQPRALFDWSGELGYQGAGYVEVARHDGWLGRRPVGEATMSHVGDRRLLRYAVVGPSGVGRSGWDLLLPAAWDQVRGRTATYSVVRVAVADDPGAAARADGLLAAVLDRLAPPG